MQILRLRDVKISARKTPKINKLAGDAGRGKIYGERNLNYACEGGDAGKFKGRGVAATLRRENGGGG